MNSFYLSFRATWVEISGTTYRVDDIVVLASAILPVFGKRMAILPAFSDSCYLGSIYTMTFLCKNGEICLRFTCSFTRIQCKRIHKTNDFWIRRPKWRLQQWSQEKHSCKQQKTTWNGYMNFKIHKSWPWYSQERLVQVSDHHFVKADTRFFHRPVFSHAASRQWCHASYWAWYHIPRL